MQTGSITRKVLMNWYALSFTAIFTLGLTGAVGLTTARKTSFHPTAGAPIHDGVGDAPVAVVAGDFNKAGLLDLAVANSAGNSVSILLGQGDGTFARSSGSAFSTGGNLTTAVAVGDFNNDGKLDVVATDLPGGLSGGIGDIFGSPGGNISVFLGNGDGTFGGHKDTDGGGDFKSSDFQGFANQIQHEVCDTHDMPHAQVPFGVDGTKIGFWHDAVAQQDLGNFLHGQNISSCLPHD